MTGDLFAQAKTELMRQLSARWQSYQRALSGKGFPQGDGQQLLPSPAVFAACSAERSTAAAGASAADGSNGSSSISSFEGAGSGLWPYLHSVYFQDTDRKVPRWVLFVLAVERGAGAAAALAQQSDV
jgi:hypothetical protein